MLNISNIKIPDSYIQKGNFSSLEKTVTPKGIAGFSHIMYFLFALFFLILFLPWTQNIDSYGTVTSLLPGDRPQTVNSVIAGRIEKWYVAEGQFVRTGDTILKLSEIKDDYFNPDLIKRTTEQVSSKESSLNAIENKANALKRQMAALKQGQDLSMQKASNKIRQSQLKVITDSIDLIAVRLEYNIAVLQMERQQNLYDKGLKSLTELEQRKIKLQETSAKVVAMENKFLTSQNELLNSKIELNSLKAEYGDKLNKAESEYNTALSYGFDTEGSVAKMKNDLANYNIRIQNYFITAPKSGYAIKALHSGIGEIIKEGEAVITIADAESMNAVELFVKPMDVPLLTKGSKVRLQFDGWPALVFAGWPGSSFGTFGGKIEVIDRINSSNGKFRILVVPDTAEIPWPKQVRMGGGVYGWALLNDVPIWFEIWRQINGFPPDWIEHKDEIENEKSNE